MSMWGVIASRTPAADVIRRPSSIPSPSVKRIQRVMSDADAAS